MYCGYALVLEHLDMSGVYTVLKCGHIKENPAKPY